MACGDTLTAKGKMTELSILFTGNITKSWSHKKVIKESAVKKHGGRTILKVKVCPAVK